MIYIMQNKEAIFPVYRNYKPLKIGALYDGKYEDNIEHLNPYLNEYTGMYIMWKHMNDSIIGLSHYRRFFVNNGYFLQWYEAEFWLQYYDIITTYDYIVCDGIYKNLYNEIGTERDKKALEKYCEILFRAEPGLRDWFKHSLGFNPRNMFVCRKALIDKYFEWIFPLIIPLTERFVKEDLDNVDNIRIPAYIAERCFGYWLRKKNNLSIKRMDYFQTDQVWEDWHE